MNILKKRFSSKEILQLFILTSFIIHVIAILNTLNYVPSWLLYMSPGEILGMASYTLSYVLFETIFVFLALVILGAIFPQKRTKSRPVFISIIFLLELTLAAVIIRIIIDIAYPYGQIIALLVIILMIFIYRYFRASRIGAFFLSVADRVSILTFIYIISDFVGLIIVLVRNI